ncbi:PIN domain-containing protein [Mucilaginibacter sp. ZT4R22]|uniref:PIN domain-containing protein n=1 Tax=Mucilaginibacter pankratovii TaxID=2772110 RepID=A0ABR7WR82_9SPHI|nr:PIN domain-containing protein [Mucilaginibacter pankratovii]MBD1364816.1 PIN domain-containing protein [Mucilaginibacter pankratovii]
MAYRYLYVDSDVLLDLVLLRTPFFGYTQLLLHESEKRKLELRTSALVFANMNYILSKKNGAQAAKESLRTLRSLINILPFEGDSVDWALSSPFADFEDAIQNHIAIKHNCDIIITRNIKDYKQSTIPVLTAEQFLRTIL